jgi:Family of unknown function (DUF6131)
VLILGIVLAVLGWLTGIAIVLYIGVVLLVVGAVLLLAGGMGHSMGGRRFWF